MEWLGQYIQAYKARFRNEVYLEDLTTTTETSVLVVDSVGLVSKSTSVGGDITGVDLTGTAPINIGSETNTTGGAYSSTIGIDIGNGLVVSSGDLEVKEDEIDHDSLDQYAANQHVVWANASQGTIHSSNIPTLNQNTTGQAATVATIAGLAPNTATTAAEQPAIESIGTDGDTLQILADELLMSNATADAPIIKLINTTNDDQGSQLIFEKLRADDAVAVGQNVGEIWFRGQDAAQNTQNYGFILGEIDVSTSGQESGKVSLGIANHDGGNGRGLILTGGSENNEVDVTLGLGANSVVTVPGDIDLEGDIDVNGTLETDALTIGGATIAAIGTTAITTLGTIGTGVWNGTAIASANLDADTMHYSAQRQLTHHTIQDDIDTQVVFLSLTDFDAENTTIGNNKLPLIAPVAGKLLKVFVRCSHNLSGVDFTWKLYTRTSSQSTNGNAAEIGAQTGTGPTNGNMVTYDFTTGLDSGTNAIGAGDKVQISLETDGSTSNANFFITLMWEWNLS